MSTDDRSSPAIQSATLAATSASLAAFTSAVAAQCSEPNHLVSAGCIAWLLMMVVWVWFRRRSNARQQVAPIAVFLVILTIIPAFGEVISRVTGNNGHPLEIVLLANIQLVACGLATTSCWTRFQPLTLVASLFVVLFACSISQDPSTRMATGLFAILGLTWLVMSHWSGLRHRLNKEQRRTQPRTLFWIPLVVASSLLLGAVAIQSDQTWALAGFLPSSGGDGRDDATATRGAGNGEALVAGQDQIQSFGPIENAPFRASEDPSLYDLFNDTYDEPVKIKDQQRAIPLPADLKNQIENRMANSEKAGKEFSIVRKQRQRAGSELKNLHSDALLYVKGRVPLHLRQELFDLFDGITWHAEVADQHQPTSRLSLKNIAERPWICWPEPPRSYEYFGPVENHALKVVHLKSNRIPSPLNLLGVHIDKIDRLDFFRVVGDQLLALDTKTLPDLTSLHLQSRTIKQEELARSCYWVSGIQGRYTMLPDDEQTQRIHALAIDWTMDLPFGWPQVEAITKRLRSDYLFDPDARPSAHTDNPTADFLFRSRRGPDYQFATAAAVMLRTLGYPTRLVGGFYVNPVRYDRLKQHTPVVSADTHVWIEVCHSVQQWVTVEPTPGYEILSPPLDWWQYALASICRVAVRLVANWHYGITAFFLVTSAWWSRAAWMDWLIVFGWTCFPALNSRARILQTAWMLDQRLWIAGSQRSPGETWTSTIHQLSQLVPQLDAHGQSFARLVEWARFSPASEPIPDESRDSWKASCHQVVIALNRTSLSSSTIARRRSSRATSCPTCFRS